MPRFDPLSGSMAVAVAEPSSKKTTAKRGTRSAKPTRAEVRVQRAKVTFDVTQIPVATIACMLQTSDLRKAGEAKAAFANYVIAHPKFTDWRAAWNAFAQRPTPQVKANALPERGKIVAMRPAPPPAFTTAAAAADFIRNL